MYCFEDPQTDKLTGRLIGLARATEGNEYMLTDSTAAVIMEGLIATAGCGGADNDALLKIMERADAERRKLVPDCYHCAASCGRNNDYDMSRLHSAGEEIRSLKSQLLRAIRSIAVHAHSAAAPVCSDEALHDFLYKALFAIGMDDWGTEELLPILQEADDIYHRLLLQFPRRMV